MGRLRRKHVRGAPRPLRASEKLKLSLCDFSGPYPECRTWSDDERWTWWQENRDAMIAAIRKKYGPGHLPAAAEIFDGDQPKTPGPRKPADVIEFGKQEDQ